MKKSTKILLGAFTLLLLITLSEIIYYFFFLSPDKTRTTVNTPPQPATTVSSDPLAQQYISSYVSNLNATLKEPVVASTGIITKFEGTIADIDPDNGTIKDNEGKEIAYSARIQLEENGDTYTILYNDNNLRALKVTEKDTATQLKLADLEKGDTIQIEQQVTFFKKPSQNNATTIITRL